MINVNMNVNVNTVAGESTTLKIKDFLNLLSPDYKIYRDLRLIRELKHMKKLCLSDYRIKLIEAKYGKTPHLTMSEDQWTAIEKEQYHAFVKGIGHFTEKELALQSTSDKRAIYDVQMALQRASPKFTMAGGEAGGIWTTAAPRSSSA